MDKQLWKALLIIREQLKQFTEKLRFCHIQSNGEIGINEVLPADPSSTQFFVDFTDSPSKPPKNVAHFRIINLFEFQTLQTGSLPTEAIHFLEVYLPYCFLPYFSRQKKRAITTAHFAQSLDGKIATLSGHSKWIGNEENLIHAHRMRALCDAVLIGTGTLLRDQPRLTVRMVDGPNPTRIVLGQPGVCDDYNCLYESCKRPIIVIGSTESSLNGQIDYIRMEATEGRVNSIHILEALYQRGIHSVYLEGGAITTSNFLKDKAVDVLQLHLSPLIFGSGKSAITLPEIDEVKNAIKFSAFQFKKVGDAMMFIGQLH